jgi:hypothetical protein
MKRTVFLAVALFALMAVGVYAQTEADFDVSKSKDGKSITIGYYNGSATAVNIPAKIQNLPVTEIGRTAFSQNSKITSVTIPNGVTTIGSSAFANCNQLTSVTIPSSVKIIESNAFENCLRITSITIPASVTSITVSAFSGCAGLTSITIPASVTEIKINAFSYCRGLTSVTFGGSIPSSNFHANAFNGIGDIRDKYFAAGGGAGTYTRPDSTSTTWTKGGSATTAPATAGTPGLAFTLTSDKKGYSVNKGTLAASSEANVVIPATYNNLPVTTIASSAFDGCASIPSVTIPASVTLIDAGAFTTCVSLKSITFGGANTRFDFSAFYNGGGDLSQKYKAGGAGTYTTSDGKTWTKK